MRIIIKYILILTILSISNGCQKIKDCKTISSIDNIVDNRFDTTRRKLYFWFYNNPYGIDDSSKIQVFLNDTLVASGYFVYGFRVYIPIEFFGRRNEATVIFENKEGDEYYKCEVDNHFYLDYEDKDICGLFCPDNDENSDLLFFTQKVDLR